MRDFTELELQLISNAVIELTQNGKVSHRFPRFNVNVAVQHSLGPLVVMDKLKLNRNLSVFIWSLELNCDLKLLVFESTGRCLGAPNNHVSVRAFDHFKLALPSSQHFSRFISEAEDLSDT